MSTRASIQSFTTRLLNARDQMNFEEMTDEELRSTLEEAMRMNRSLTLENEVLERFLLRKDPQSLHNEQFPDLQVSFNGQQNVQIAQKIINIFGRNKSFEKKVLVKPESSVIDEINPRMGMYKLHTEATTWVSAKNTCTIEGGIEIEGELSSVVDSARQAQKILGLHGLRRESGSHLSQSSSNRDYKSESSQSLSSSQAHSVTASAATHQHSLRFTKGLKLTIQHRIELVDKETDEMKKQYVEFEKITTKKRGILHARLEEIKHRVIECRETGKMFDEEVVQRPDPNTKTISVETFVRFIENQAQRVMSIVDKYNCKIVTAKRLIKLAKKQIEKREDVANILRPIDFEKLKIENKYIVRDNEWNHNHLNALKLLSGHYNLVLKYRKEAILDRKSTLCKIERNIELKKRHNVMLRHTQTIAAHDVKKALAQMKSIKELRDEYETPEVIDFLEVQKELQEEQKKFARLNRQRKIQLFTLKLTRKAQQ